MGKLIPFQPPPGVYKNGTPYQAKGRWSDCNLVRWKDGLLQPLGGWEEVIQSTITGIGRAMITWRDFTGARWMAIGTNEKLYIFTSLSGTASDITPDVTPVFVVGNTDGEIGLGFGTGDFGGTVTRASVTGTDITFTAPATISSTSTRFTDATTTADTVPATTTLSPEGPNPFAVGDEIEISGSSQSGNNRSYTGAGGITTGSHRVVSVVTNASSGASTMTVGPSSNATDGGGTAAYGAPVATVDTFVNDTGHTNDITIPLVPLTGGSGSGAQATVNITTSGVVEFVTITTGGAGYVVDDVLTISGSIIGGSDMTCAVATLGSSSAVLVTDSTPGETITITRTRRFGNENAGSSSLVLEAASWVFDLWGENLVGMSTADGRIYEWDPTDTNATSTKASLLTHAPINNAAILVSKQRHLFVFGAGGNNRKIQWSHIESIDSASSWAASATNQAGSFEIDTAGEIMAGKTVGDRILVWTTQDLHAVDWTGMPYVYGQKKIGDGCGCISNRSMIAVGDKAFWMSQGGFFTYQGSVQPLKCDVQDHIFKDINRVQDSKIYASTNPEFFEVTWWYASSTSDEILKYVTYNYAEGWWSVGELCRTAFATGSPGVFPNPIGIADDGKIYEHEIDSSSGKRTTSQVASTNADVSDYDRKLVTGTDATDDVGLCFAEAVMEIDNGENVTNITQLVTDTAGVGDNGLRFKFKTSYTPNGEESTSQNYDLAPDGYTDVREQGRQFTYRVESGWDQSWEIGSIRAMMSAGGKR